jgi:hypothetical protein
MKVGYCPNCEKETGYQRKLGFGTLFAVILTGGLWLLVLPFYPKRCSICGKPLLSSQPSTAPRPVLRPPTLDDGKKKCPHCAELINLAAIKCKFCGESFDPDAVAREVAAIRAAADAETAAMLAAGRKRCSYCGLWDVVTAVRHDGGTGPFCPHCQKDV